MSTPRKQTTDAEIADYTIGEVIPHNASVFVAEYDAAWPAMYEREARRIRGVLAEGVLRLEHIGSTSVPALAAKPLIDILLMVEDSSHEDSYVPALENAGYVLRIRESGWHEHRLFGSPDTELNLHVFSRGCVEIDRMISFRDWLRTHADDRARYEQAKRELASREWKHVQHYADAKTEVIEQILAHATAVSHGRSR